MRKLSVSLGSLTPSGTFSTKFILESSFQFRAGNVLLKSTLKMACAQKIDLIGSKYGVCCTSYQSLEKFGACWEECAMSENWFFRRFPIQTLYFCVIVDLWELACISQNFDNLYIKFHILTI